MKLGVAIRSMGPQATAETILACAAAAESAGLDDVFIQDHVAIPPDDAEGSNGRYLDPLTTLAFLAAGTERIGLGTGVLILPYRPKLPTAKAIATVQELSGGRLQLGVGIGWMDPEFRALGVDRHERGRLSDEALDFFNRCFAEDVLEENGQRFLFRPRPARPPILIGGAAPHALERCLRYGDGWMPMGGNPDKLRGPIAQLRERAAEAGRPKPQVVLLTGLPLDDAQRSVDMTNALAEIGVTSIVHASRYSDAAVFQRDVDLLAGKVLPALPRS